MGLPSQYVGKHQGGNDGGVGFDDEFGRVHVQLAPCDFLVGHGSGIRAVRCGAVGDLAEVFPQRSARPAEVLFHHRHDTNGEISGCPSRYLEETDTFASGVRGDVEGFERVVIVGKRVLTNE